MLTNFYKLTWSSSPNKNINMPFSSLNKSNSTHTPLDWTSLSSIHQWLLPPPPPFGPFCLVLFPPSSPPRFHLSPPPQKPHSPNPLQAPLVHPNILHLHFLLKVQPFMTMLPTAASSSADVSSPDAFFDLSTLIDKLNPILAELNHNKTLTGLPQIHQALKSLDQDLNRAGFLLSGSKSVEKQVEEVKMNLGRSLGLVMVTLTGVDLEEGVRERMGEIRKEMMSAGSSPAGLRSSWSEIEEERVGKMEAEDVVVQIKNGGDKEEVMLALWGLNDLIRDKVVGSEWISEEDVAGMLLKRLSSAKSSNVRLTIIKTLRNVVAEWPGCKEKMVDVVSLGTLVKSLGREAGERREASGLLLTLAEVPAGRRRIGRVQGCIVMLVSMVNGDDQVGSCYSLSLLNALSSDTQNALHMAEAGYFKPLVQHLRDGMSF